jgi:hypothetical protein
MEITPHLSESELAEFISDPTLGLGTHLEFCDSCLNEVARLRETAAAMKAITDEPQEFWHRQRTAIRTQIASAPAQPASHVRGLAWVPALAVLVLAGLLLSGGSPPPPAIEAGKPVDPDHELLLAVERVMQSNGPEALEPATYFVQEIKQGVNPKRNSIRNQETSHAN